jgi:hypothetical protein
VVRRVPREVLAVASAALGAVACSTLLGVTEVDYASTDAGTDGERESSAVEAGADAPDASAFALQCGNAKCGASRPICCLFACSGPDQSACAADGAACPASCFRVVACDRASDCSAGMVCCGEYDSQNTSFKGAACAQLQTCQAHPHRVFCDPDAGAAACPNSVSCSADTVDPGDRYSVCQSL